MTRGAGPALLVSVRSAEEALAAIAGGADILDIKDPARGPLGRADDAAIASVLATVGTKRPTSIALGELTDYPPPPQTPPPEAHGPQSVEPAPPPLSTSYLKLGLARAPHTWRHDVLRLTTAYRVPMARFVAVAYADAGRCAAPPLPDVLAFAVEHRVAGLLIDTAVKDGRDLFTWCDEATLRCAIAHAHRAGLFVALAGSLQGDSLGRAASLAADIVAVRGAVCAGGDRSGGVDAALVAQVRRHVAARSLAPAADAG